MDGYRFEGKLDRHPKLTSAGHVGVSVRHGDIGRINGSRMTPLAHGFAESDNFRVPFVKNGLVVNRLIHGPKNGCPWRLTYDVLNASHYWQFNIPPLKAVPYVLPKVFLY